MHTYLAGGDRQRERVVEFELQEVDERFDRFENGRPGERSCRAAQHERGGCRAVRLFLLLRHDAYLYAVDLRARGTFGGVSPVRLRAIAARDNMALSANPRERNRRMTTTENRPARLCGRVDGATVCADECWRARALGDAECTIPHHPSCPARRCGCPSSDPHPNARCARKCVCPRVQA